MRARVGVALLLGWLAVVAAPAAAAAVAPTPVPAAVEYLDVLRQARAALAGGDLSGARAGVARAASLSPGPALDPVLADLDRSPADRADAAARLDAALAALALPAGAAPGDDAAARSSLHDVYARPEFRDLGRSPGDAGLSGVIRRLAGWLSDRAGGVPGPPGLVLGLIAAAVVGLAVFRMLRGVSAGRLVGVAEEPAAAGDDPDREWSLAEAAAGRGDHREAIRRAFRSALLAVAIRGRLPVNAAWTTRELLAVAAGDADLVAALAPAAAGFDRAWYSPAPVTEADWRVERDRCVALRTMAARRAVRA